MIILETDSMQTINSQIVMIQNEAEVMLYIIGDSSTTTMIKSSKSIDENGEMTYVSKHVKQWHWVPSYRRKTEYKA